MKNIVVGFDGSEESQDALRLAETVRAAWQAALVVAVVDEIDPLLDASALDLPSREAEYSRTFARAAEHLGRDDFERQTMIGSVPRALDLVATDSDADLLVVGSTHRGKLGRVLPGSVGSRLLSGAPCAVAVAPRGYGSRNRPPWDTIGIGYDGGAEAKAALAVGADLASKMKCNVRLIAATPKVEELEPGRIGLTAPEWARVVRTQRQEQLEAAQKAFDGDGELQLLIEEGSPPAVLAHQSAELDLLVVGSRGYGPVRRALIGGVANRLLGLATCPVVVVPRSAAPVAAAPA